ncbi:MAG: dTDP-4-dehydrorhamnose reductase [Solirubrobacteraceae bacterium]|nr:dTDP-4-dehydrorhamnose reductase [Solirubrobacteraceae bacterium]
MRVLVTGARGFVGSNVARVFAEHHGAEVLGPSHAELDVTDGDAVRRHVGAAAPDAIVHCAILNDPARLSSDRRRAWEAYVGATRHLVDAANATGAQLLLVSTDWVFDGTRPHATEDEPPCPINPYGFLKAASELVVSERAERATVARISGVNGVHWGARDVPRAQDAGFGYLVAALVQALRAGRRFRLWEGPGLNAIATPTLASEAAELFWRALERGVTGILHCCGAEAVDRAELARRTVAAFELDPELLESGPPPAGALPAVPVPRDTSLDGTATARALGTDLLDLDGLLAGLRHELDTGAPATAQRSAT